MLDRRQFLSRGAGLAAGLAFAEPLMAQLANFPASLPDRSQYANNEDAYWAELRKQFLIPADEIYLNNGTVGSSPAPVLRAVFDGYQKSEELDESDPEDYPIWGYAAWNQYRDPLAAFVGCTRDEIALVRNATEGNSYIANGVDMKPGDEVLMTDQEHPGGEQPWQLQSQALRHRGEEGHAAQAGQDPGRGAEPVQRRHHPAHARHLLQPHHHRHGGCAAGQGAVRAGAIARAFSRRWTARTCPA